MELSKGVQGLWRRCLEVARVMAFYLRVLNHTYQAVRHSEPARIACNDDDEA